MMNRFIVFFLFLYSPQLTRNFSPKRFICAWSIDVVLVLRFAMLSHRPVSCSYRTARWRNGRLSPLFSGKSTTLLPDCVHMRYSLQATNSSSALVSLSRGRWLIIIAYLVLQSVWMCVSTSMIGLTSSQSWHQLAPSAFHQSPAFCYLGVLRMWTAASTS